jgi:hypothetical protein
MEALMLIDYAHPMMMAEKHQRQAHDALLERNLAKGREELLQAIAELRLACMAITHMEEQAKQKAK